MIKHVSCAVAALVLLAAVSASAQDDASDARQIRAADPVADARRAANVGDLRLIQISGAWSGPWLPGVICFLPPSADALHVDLFHSDAIGGGADIDRRHAEIAYASAFNRATVSHRSFRFSDLCRLRTASEGEGYDDAYLSLETWRAATRRERHDGSLASAARLGDRRALSALLAAGAVVQDSDIWAMSPLSWAALRGDADVVRTLLAAGADPNWYCEQCPAPLNLAVIAGSREAVALLVSAGANLDEYTDAPQPHDDAYPGGRPVWVAVSLGRREILADLLSAGADPDAVHGYETAALLAILRRDEVSLRMLLAAGGDANAHSQGVALIQAAARVEFAAGVRALLDAGAYAEARSAFEEELWRIAAADGRDAILLGLIGNGAHLHLLNADDRAAIAAATEAGQEIIVARLIAVAEVRWRALRAAIVAGDLAQVQRLSGEGDGFMRGHGEGELLTAIEARQTSIVAWLRAEGADPTTIAHPTSVPELTLSGDRAPTWRVTDEGSVFGRVPYQYVAQTSPANLAFNTGPLELVELVVAGVAPDERNLNDPENSYLDDAFRGYYRGHRDPRIIALAFRLGGPPPRTGVQADKFLRDICFWAREHAGEVMRPYLDMGYRPRNAADPAHAPRFPSDDTALSECIRTSEPAAILLLDHGADPNQPSSIGCPALQVALSALRNPDASTRVISRLLEVGADPNAPAFEGQLRYAIARSRASVRQAPLFAEAVRLLEEAGAELRPASARTPHPLPIR